MLKAGVIYHPAFNYICNFELLNKYFLNKRC